MIDIQELKAKAEAANECVKDQIADGVPLDQIALSVAYSDLMMTLTPQAILELIARLEQSEQRNSNLSAAIDKVSDFGNEACKCYETLAKALKDTP